eukprot:10471929-Alexandrium_andersonii.AAC.1
MARTCMDEGWLKLPSAATLNRFQLVFDVGFMLWRRQTVAPLDCARYGFADSSPQGGRDWFMVKVQWIDVASLVSTMHAVQSLVADAALLPDSSDEDAEMPERTIDRPDVAEQVRSAIHVMSLPPVALGLGRATLTDKASALLYALYLESGWQHLAH